MSRPIPKSAAPAASHSALKPFEAKQFDFSDVVGLSDRALETHRALYEGYVKESNALLPYLYTEEGEARSELSDRLLSDGIARRFAFERNGMVLHELFFEALRGKSEPPSPTGKFVTAVAESYGGFERWKANVQKLAQTRGVGWVITAQTGKDNRLANVWIEEHQLGVLADWRPIVAFDLWEHAFLIDFKPSERGAYLNTLFDNLDWEVIEGRCL